MTAAVAPSGSRKTKAIVTAAVAAMVVAGLGGLSTDLGPWYASLREPPWKPPDALFGPAWTLIYACAAAAGVRAWLATRLAAQREWMLVAFGLNATLNVVWSLLFFRLHRPDWALMEVGALWASIVLLMGLLGRRSRGAAWLLAPYLVWVTFAATLNASVVELNAPFGVEAVR
ncbi:MAG TPA: TspO/MBR family protein [Burkholderiaceae bacterium]|jgi:tryptophan-rich sensory protein|nr:TspO/MBR family protein [Burkholderiaceae bacterium]